MDKENQQQKPQTENNKGEIAKTLGFALLASSVLFRTQQFVNGIQSLTGVDLEIKNPVVNNILDGVNIMASVYAIGRDAKLMHERHEKQENHSHLDDAGSIFNILSWSVFLVQSGCNIAKRVMNKDNEHSNEVVNSRKNITNQSATVQL